MAATKERPSLRLAYYRIKNMPCNSLQEGGQDAIEAVKHVKRLAGISWNWLIESNKLNRLIGTQVLLHVVGLTLSHRKDGGHVLSIIKFIALQVSRSMLHRCNRSSFDPFRHAPASFSCSCRPRKRGGSNGAAKQHHRQQQKTMAPEKARKIVTLFCFEQDGEI